ncbi:hypothetical protein D3C87_22550 [compost metagenome]
MANIDYSQVIIRLIRADLRNVHMLKVLSLFYTNTSNYRLNLYEDIFELMQFNAYENYEELKTWYLNQLENAKYVPVNTLNKVAADIYDGLKSRYLRKD